MFLIFLLVLFVLGVIAYGIIYIVNPDTAEALKEGIGSFFHTSKSRMIHIRYRNPDTGKEIDIDAISIPGKVPELQYHVSKGNQKLYSGDRSPQRRRIKQ